MQITFFLHTIFVTQMQKFGIHSIATLVYIHYTTVNMLKCKLHAIPHKYVAELCERENFWRRQHQTRTVFSIKIWFPNILDSYFLNHFRAITQPIYIFNIILKVIIGYKIVCHLNSGTLLRNFKAQLDYEVNLSWKLMQHGYKSRDIWTTTS